MKPKVMKFFTNIVLANVAYQIAIHNYKSKFFQKNIPIKIYNSPGMNIIVTETSVRLSKWVSFH